MVIAFMREFNDDNFDAEVLSANDLVLVDFWAPWCGPCRMVAPIIDQIAEQYVGRLKVGKVNVDENKALSAKYEVMSIPTILLFKDGKVAEKIIGARSKASMEALIDEYL